jgi:hypothetical protein
LGTCVKTQPYPIQTLFCGGIAEFRLVEPEFFSLNGFSGGLIAFAGAVREAMMGQEI